jgi:hypothetical protein
MSMVCPQCNAAFEQRLQCPNCAVRLLYQSSRRASEAGLPGQAGQWQHTPWGRIFIGVVLAQGLYHGLQQLCTAGLLAVSEETQNVWTTLFGLILLQGIQGIGLLAGGMLAGAGQRRGLLLGAVVGVWNGAVLILIEHWRTRSGAAPGTNPLPLTAVTAYGQPLLLSAFGAIGGLIGSLIWKPLPALSIPDQPTGKAALKLSDRRRRALLAGPVAWPRVLIGIALAVSGSLWANGILSFVMRALERKLAITSRLQAQLVTMEICALAALLGSCLAGATTSNGLKQGLIVGIGSAVILVGIQLAAAAPALDRIFLTAAGTATLALVGGWFGGQLFPPVIGPRRFRRAPAAGF